MKKDRDKKVRGIEEALKAAHRRQVPQGLSGGFAEGVMREVRRLDRSGAGSAVNGFRSDRDASPTVEPRMVWGFAAATTLLALLAFAYFLGSDPNGLQYDIAEYAAGDSSALMLAHSLAVI